MCVQLDSRLLLMLREEKEEVEEEVEEEGLVGRR
jgi:hypothetical protein